MKKLAVWVVTLTAITEWIIGPTQPAPTSPTGSSVITTITNA